MTFNFWRPVSAPPPIRFKKLRDWPDYDFQEWMDTKTGDKKWIPAKQALELGIDVAFQMEWPIPGTSPVAPTDGSSEESKDLNGSDKQGERNADA
jgi:hypothetical protein